MDRSVTLGSIAKSLILTARLRARGHEVGTVTCDGRYPVVHTDGIVQLGRVALGGATTPVELGARRSGHLFIGNRVYINQGATIVATTRITIGDDCRIGDYVAIYDSAYHPIEAGSPISSATVTIGLNVWLARGVVVLPGVTIGDHAVVAANAVVTADVASRTLVGGVPARPIRTLVVPEEWRRP